MVFYDDCNESELYSEECMTEKWTGRTHEDDAYDTFEDLLVDEYQENPAAFSEKRDEIYCFSYFPSQTKCEYDKWTLVDCDREIVYAVFDTTEQLTDFLQPSRVRRAIRRILMDRVVELDPDKSRAFMMDKCLDVDTICLIKDCVAAHPRGKAFTYFSDDDLEFEVGWDIRNLTADREKALCAELFEAGIENEKTQSAAYPF